MIALPDYRSRSILENPYFLGGAALVVVGFGLQWWQERPDDISKELGADAARDASVTGLSLLKTDLTPAEAAAFKASLPQLGQQYADMFVTSGRVHGVSPFILAGLMQQESGFGKGCKLPACKGYKVVAGHGDYGLMQINSKAHPVFFAKQVNGRPAYEDPASVVDYGASVYANGLRYLSRKNPSLTGLELLRAAASAYNAGAGAVNKALSKGKNPDSVTTGKDYGKSVMKRASAFLSKVPA